AEAPRVSVCAPGAAPHRTPQVGTSFHPVRQAPRGDAAPGSPDSCGSTTAGGPDGAIAAAEGAPAAGVPSAAGTAPVTAGVDDDGVGPDAQATVVVSERTRA